MSNLKLSNGAKFDSLIRVNHPDPDVERRGQLLSILLLSIGAAVILFCVIGLAVNIFSGWSRQDEILLFAISAMGIVFIAGMYVLNHSGRVYLAAILFLIGSLILISFSDDPAELVSGRSTMMYILLIVMASVLLRPAAAFLMAGLSGLMLLVLSLLYQLPLATLLPTVMVEIIIFLVIAMVSWLAARSLEKALTELRVINADLDQRVADRTQDLAEALIRVQLESSKNQAILEGIADGVIVFDHLGVASVVNPAICQLLNLSPQQILDQHIETLMADQVGKNDQRFVLDQLFRQDSPARLPGLQVQWGSKTLSASFAPIQIQQEKVRSTVAVFRDVTREAELDRMKTMFVSMVSHELRTPLGAIIGYGEILQEQVHGVLNERQLGVVERLIANTKRLLNLVNDLLDRARLEAGRLKLNPTLFAPAVLLEELVATTGQLARAKNLELITHIAPDMPQTISADAQRVQQILVNLVTNAIKFTDHGSVVIKFDRPDRSHWSIEVSDTGIGISPEDQAHVFDMFRQANGSTTRKQSGAGLGLSIVKQLVTLMGGDIQVVSSVGRGSTFTLYLPLNLTAEGARD